MAYRRGGIFRSRFIAPVSQRATEILSKPVVVQARIEFDAGAIDLAGTWLNGQTASVTMTVAPADNGRERLVITGALSANTTANFSSCTVDGQVATVAGSTVRGAGSGQRVFLKIWRVPGTSNTSITISSTASVTGGNSITSYFVSCWKMSNVGTLLNQIVSSVNDPSLSLGTPTKGILATASMGFGTGLFGGGDAFAWTGATERFENHAAANVGFSSASDDILTGEAPRSVSLSIIPDLSAGTTSKASTALSFNPVQPNSVVAGGGYYDLTGVDPTLVKRVSVLAAPASYTLTGSPATAGNIKKVVAVPGSYVLTGTAATPSRSAGSTASIVFDAALADGTDKVQDAAYTFPLTVAPAPGERLVILGGIAGTDGDFYLVTIDGQVATRVGFVVNGTPEGAGYCSFLTAYRAPGTPNTSINVVATVLGGLKMQLSGYCACFHMSGVGALHATTNSAVNDPTLNTDTVSSGAVVAAILGFDLGGAPSNATTWTGLTERFDDVNTAGVEVFSGASANVSGGELPRAISVNTTPNLTTVGEDSVVSICLSFLPSGAAGTRLVANPGSYVMTGTPVVASGYGRRIGAVSGTYGITGIEAISMTTVTTLASAGAYTLTGQPAALYKSGANKSVFAIPGAYTLTGRDATFRFGRGKLLAVAGSYAITGTIGITGRGLIAVPGAYALTGRAASPVYRAGPNVSFALSGTQMTASTGGVTVSATTGAGVFVTGTSMTVHLSDVSVSAMGGMAISVTGNLMTASTGGVTVSVVGGTELVNVTGTSMTASVGSVGQSARVIVTGTSMTASVGDVVVDRLGSHNERIIGNEMTASVGDVTVRSSANVSVTGTEMTASVGTVTMESPNVINLTGTQVTASVGSVTVSAKQNVVVNVTGNAMQSYVGRLAFVGGGPIVIASNTNREGQMLRPSNWMGG